MWAFEALGDDMRQDSLCGACSVWGVWEMVIPRM